MNKIYYNKILKFIIKMMINNPEQVSKFKVILLISIALIFIIVSMNATARHRSNETTEKFSILL